MSNFEDALHKINRFISFEPGDRERYMRDLENVIKDVISKLRSTNNFFKRLYKGWSFQGSYADNLKITKPDEYDIILRLILPQAEYAEIECDPEKAGYVKINIKKVLKQLQKNGDSLHESLIKLCDTNYFLDQKKISSWFESMMSHVINSMNIFSFDDKNYTISYCKTGPAHTLCIQLDYLDGEIISVDLVPGFLFNESKWVSTRCYSQYNNYKKDWFAIPKPTKDPQPNKIPNISFISSFCDTERDIIKNKHQLKNGIKLLKKIRNKQNVKNLKSYHIKTVFLWEDEKIGFSLWNQSASFVFLHMFKKLIECVKNKELLYFWNSSQNMFDNLTDNQIKTMAGQLEAVYNKINKKKDIKPIPRSLFEEYLTDFEIKTINAVLEQQTAHQFGYDTYVDSNEYNEHTLEQRLEDDNGLDRVQNDDNRVEEYNPFDTIQTVAKWTIAIGSIVTAGIGIFNMLNNNNRNHS